MRSLRASLALVLVAACSSPGDADPLDAGHDGASSSADARSEDAGDAEDAAALDDAGAPDAARTYTPAPFTPTAATRAYCQAQGRDPDVVEARITALLSQLTPAEKLSLMSGASFFVTEGAWLVRGIPRLGIPSLRMLDGPRGVARISGKRATVFPVAMMRGASFDPALEERVGRAVAIEMRAAGANVALAPTVNILRHPRWGRAQETYGEDSHHMGELGLAFVQGVQSEGVLASVKHFAVNSIEDTRHEVDVQLAERTLRDVYLPHFRRIVVDGHVASVMSAYNSVNGQWCDQNAHLLTDILRGEWEFAGFVESDWFLGTHGDVESVRAGLDIEMPVTMQFTGLRGALESGAITEEEIDRSVRRILRAMFCFGLDEQTPVDDPSMRETAAHLALAREVAARGIVLLRNEQQGGAAPGDPPLLPLPSSMQRVAVLGRAADVENIGDTGSSAAMGTDVITALEGLAARSTLEVVHVPGASLDAAAEQTVRGADVVVIVTGMLAADEGENTIGGGDRESLALPPEEIGLIHAVAAIHSAVIVVLEGGAAIVTTDWDQEVEALLFAFYPGAQGGHAIADVLMGDVAPSGRLPFSIPEHEADLPPFDNVSSAVTYEYLHGYRWLAERGTTGRYPFGFGLSTTTFSYSDASVSVTGAGPDARLVVTFTLTNTGGRRGREVPQLYVSVPGSSYARAPQELRAFTGVELDPAESRTVELSLRASDLAVWDESMGRFVIEARPHALWVASSSRDLLLRVEATPPP